MAKSNVSAVTHLLPTVNEGFISTLGSTISSGASVVPLTDITGLVNGSTFVGIIEPAGAKQQVFTGIVDTGGNQITGVKWTRGTNVSHSGGVTVVDYITGTVINMLTKWAAVQHNDDGSHSAVTAASVAISGALSAASSTISGNETVGGTLSVTGNSTFTGTTRTVPTVITSASTITPSSQIYDVTALGVPATIAVPSFTAANGQALIIRIKDDGTARALTFASGYTNVSGLDTPTTTVAGKLLTIGALYNSATSKWEIQGINQGA